MLLQRLLHPRILSVIQGCWPCQWSISQFCLLLHGLYNLSPRCRTAQRERERSWSQSNKQPSQRKGQTDRQSQKVKRLAAVPQSSACDVHFQVRFLAWFWGWTEITVQWQLLRWICISMDHVWQDFTLWGLWHLWGASSQYWPTASTLCRAANRG